MILKTIINTKYSAFSSCLALSLSIHAIAWFCAPTFRGDLRLNELYTAEQVLAPDRFIEVKLPHPQVTSQDPSEQSNLKPVPKAVAKRVVQKKRTRSKPRLSRLAKKTLPKKISQPSIPSSVSQSDLAISSVEETSTSAQKTTSEVNSAQKNEEIASQKTTQQVQGQLTNRELRGLLKGYYNSLNSLMASQRDYPRSARRLGLEGRVLVELVINNQGEITSVKVVRSSGHDLLDQAAIAQVTKMRRVPSFPQEINKRSMTFQIGFDYILQS